MIDFEIRQGDVLARLREMPDASVNCVVTSPPYWGLRDYGTAKWIGGIRGCDHAKRIDPRHQRPSGLFHGGSVEGNLSRETVYREVCLKCGAHRVDDQIGLEPTPEAYVARLVEVFREVRRVLTSDGTCWLNLGDSYATGGGKVGHHPGGGTQGERWAGRGMNTKDPKWADALGPISQPNRMPIAGLKPKDLVGIPWRAAFALQADGWYLRSDIIWAKPNPMPESVRDRPTKSHEYVFLLTKSAKYAYDADAIAEPSVSDHGSGNGYKRAPRLGYLDKNGAPRGSDTPWTAGKNGALDRQAAGRRMVENVARARADGAAHDTPFGATRNARTVWMVTSRPYKGAHFATFPLVLPERCILAGCPPGGLVLDPFAGAGTTGIAALKHGRRFVGIELNPAYIAMAMNRLDPKPKAIAMAMNRLDPKPKARAA